MTTPIKSRRFRLRRDTAAGAEEAGIPARAQDQSDALFDEETDAPEPVSGNRPSAAPPATDKQPDPAQTKQSYILRRTSRRPAEETSQQLRDAPETSSTPADGNATPARPRPKFNVSVETSNTAGGQDNMEGVGTPAPQGRSALAPARESAIAAIKQEGLTARQLRMAMRVATQHGIRAASAFEAIYLLRERGIDPFARSTMLDLVRGENSTEVAKRTNGEAPPPAIRRDAPAPAQTQDKMGRVAAQREKELRDIQKGIVRRRRKRFLLLGARLLAFVTLPTFLVTYYFYILATPMYATEAQFVIQQADPQSQAAGGLAGMMPSAAGLGLGGPQEATSVQAYLQSRGAMQRLNEEEGFKAHFQDTELDMIRRLDPDASDEAAYKVYKRHVKIGFDPTEGIVRMEVIAATPEDSQRFARALIDYAEEHVDMMTQRLRDSQMRDARQSLEDAEAALIEARRTAVELQESSAVISGEVELQLVSQQIAALETELTQSRLSLQEMRSNVRPNQARMQPLERRVQALEEQIANLRASLTQGDGQGASLARTQSQLIMAEAEVQTREMMRAQAMQALETARTEVSRQVRYLALTVEPVAPDEATHPRKFEYSLLAFLIFCGAYLFISMTVSVLREQVSG